jgi:CubicO group peptidase (beta-lactamase class C family)
LLEHLFIICFVLIGIVFDQMVMWSHQVVVCIIITLVGVTSAAVSSSPFRFQTALAEDQLFGAIPHNGDDLPRISSPLEESSSSPLSDDDLITKIRAIVKQSMDLNKVPGLSLSVIHKGVPLMAEGFGFADVANRIPGTYICASPSFGLLSWK